MGIGGEGNWRMSEREAIKLACPATQASGIVVTPLWASAKCSIIATRKQGHCMEALIIAAITA